MTKEPTSAEIFAKIQLLKEIDADKLETLRTWVFENTQEIKSSISKFIEKIDYKEDPELYTERLYKYHLLCGGMAGLVEGLYEKAIFLPYKELTEDSRNAASVNKQKLTAGDREIYAKGRASDLKALRRDLEETISNLSLRIYGSRAQNKKW
jgi:hypothetical protein